MSTSILQNVGQGTLKSVKTAILSEKVLLQFNESVCPLLDMIQTKINEKREPAKLRDWLLLMLMNGQAAVE